MANIQETNIHALLSDLNDFCPNIYQMAKDLAGIAKQVKENTKEEAEPPKPVLEAIEMMYASKFSN